MIGMNSIPFQFWELQLEEAAVPYHLAIIDEATAFGRKFILV